MEGDGAVVLASEVTCLGLSDALRSGGVEVRAPAAHRPQPHIKPVECKTPW